MRNFHRLWKCNYNCTRGFVGKLRSQKSLLRVIKAPGCIPSVMRMKILHCLPLLRWALQAVFNQQRVFRHFSECHMETEVGLQVLCSADGLILLCAGSLYNEGQRLGQCQLGMTEKLSCKLQLVCQPTVVISDRDNYGPVLSCYALLTAYLKSHVLAVNKIVFL